MKILHVLTLLTPDGAYGGPARVAVNQAAGLTERGHDVVIASGVAGFDEPPSQMEGTPVVAFPARRLIPGVGYASMFAPGLRRWLRNNLDVFDVVHIHLARDLVTAPAASVVRRSGVPYVIQSHGMITPGSHPLAGLFDRRWTRACLQGAGNVFCLNETECVDVSAVAGPQLRVDVLPNGIPAHADHQGVTFSTDRPEVLFLARLHARKRPELFAEAALALLHNGINARFAVVGPPEGAESAVDDAIGRAEALGYGAEVFHREPAVRPERTRDRMTNAAVYVLPAAREPFGMTIIEALSVGVPVVICDDGGLAEFVKRNDCGLVVDGSVDGIASAIAALLDDPAAAREMGRRGRVAVNAEFGIGKVVDVLEESYGALARTGGGARSAPGC